MANRSGAAWAKLVREWRESGLSARAFGTGRGLSHRTLQWWASKLKKESAQLAVRPLTFVEVAQPVSPRSERFEVHLANGRRVVVPSSFDPEGLARILEICEGSR